jgi:hypothetical protein
MEWIQDICSAFVGGLVRLFFVSVVVWMAGLIFVLCREMFRPDRFKVKTYLYQVWKMFYFSLEWVAYLAVFIAPVYMIWSQKYWIYSMVTVDAFLLAVFYLFLRKKRRRRRKILLYPRK